MLEPSLLLLPNPRSELMMGGHNSIPPLSPLRAPSGLFTGRCQCLQDLKDFFLSQPDNERKRYLLYGMGGIGKTQICLKFIEQYGKKCFSDIFWIDASSEDAIDLSLRQIAAQKIKVDIIPSAESALEWISGRSGWLLVYDNAASGGLQLVEKSIPSGNEGNILITSRDQAFARITSQSFKVTEMEEEDAIALLLKSAMFDNTQNVPIAAEKLAKTLSGIPLVIDQAGSYIQSCGCGFDHYLRLFIQNHAQLLSDKEFKGASLYGNSVYGTLDISMEEIKHRAEDENSDERLAAQSALILYNTFAFLHHNNISAQIFENAALNFVEKKDEITNGLPQSTSLLEPRILFLKDDGCWDEMLFEAGIRLLLSFSLISAYEKSYSVHPLVQTWSRDRMNKNMEEHCMKARAILACSVKLDYEDDNHEFYTNLASHIKANNQYSLQDEYFDDECCKFAFVFDRIGSWDDAKALEVQMLEARKMNLGTDHADTLNAMVFLASTCRNLGKWKEAEELLEVVVDTGIKKVGAEDPSILNVKTHLASTYRDLGNWSNAEGLQECVVGISMKKLGAGNSFTLNAKANLASIYWHQKRWYEAEILQRQILDAKIAKFGKNHPSTLNAMANLASTYSSQGKWGNAEDMQRQVLDASEKKLGRNHQQTLNIMANLALTYRDQKRWDKAETLQKEVLKGLKEILGVEHPSTLNAMMILASIYMGQTRWNLAEECQKQVMDRCEKNHGDHPFMLNVMANLAIIYRNQGKLTEATTLQERVVEATRKRLGNDHPDAQNAITNLAFTYREQGRWGEARSLEEQMMNTPQVIFGFNSDFPRILLFSLAALFASHLLT